MLFAIHCLDRPGTSALRQATAAEHSEYMAAHRACLVFGGPLLADDGQTRIGLMVVLDLPSRAETEAFLAAEPYYRAGLFGHCSVTPYQLIVGKGPGATEGGAASQKEIGDE